MDEEKRQKILMYLGYAFVIVSMLLLILKILEII